MLNLTPHPISVKCADGTLITYPVSGVVARVSTVEYVLGSRDIFLPGTEECDGQGNSNGFRVPVVRREFGEVTGLPTEGTPCIVSAMVLSACPGRKGVYAPDTGDTAGRNSKGFVEYVTRLVAA